MLFRSVRIYGYLYMHLCVWVQCSKLSKPCQHMANACAQRGRMRRVTCVSSFGKPPSPPHPLRPSPFIYPLSPAISFAFFHFFRTRNPLPPKKNFGFLPRIPSNSPSSDPQRAAKQLTTTLLASSLPNLPFLLSFSQEKNPSLPAHLIPLSHNPPSLHF